MAQAQQAGQPNREQPGRYKRERFAHTANTKYGMGDNYGTGIKAKIGTVRRDYMGMTEDLPKKVKTPPKSLA